MTSLYTELIAGGFAIGMLGLAYNMYREVLIISKEKVDRTTCHQIHDNMEKRFEELEHHIDKRIDSLHKRIDDLINITRKL